MVWWGPRPMTTTQSALRRGIERAGQQFVLVLDPAFQGLPDTAHGGSVLAAFDTIAATQGPRTLVGHYRRRVPLDVPLTLIRTPGGLTHRFALTDPSGVLLVDGRVESPAAGSPPREPVGGREASRANVVLSEEASRPPTGGARPPLPLPVSRACLACGVDNPLGLQAQLHADERVVGVTWTPRATLCADGRVAPLALTTLLDETAFWLGALATGESGMTTELAVTLHGPVAADAAVSVWGERARVRQRADDPRYWDTHVEACDAAGRAVASARITFVAVRGAARRLVAAMLGLNPAEVVRRVFPSYAG